MVRSWQPEVHPACLFLAITKQGNVFFWPAKLPGMDGRSNSWNQSALAAAKIAESRWVRLSANLPAGLYDVHEAADNLTDPTWPELSFPELLKLCFKDRFIRALNHPLLKLLRGEA